MQAARCNILPADPTSRNWKGLYTLSGALLVLGLFSSFYVAYLGRILYSPGYPADPEAYLQFIAGRQGLAALTWTLWIVGDLLAIAPTVAMYLLLRPYHRTLALLGSLVVIFYLIYDVSVTELNSLTLVGLGQAYAAANSEAVRASLVGAATCGYYALPLETVLSFGIGSLGWLLWCIPMARSFFGVWTALFGIAVNIMGLLGAAYPLFPLSFILGLCQFLCVRLIAVWLCIIGIQLLRYVSRLPKKVADPDRARPR